MSAAVGPAADIDRNADGGWMAGSVFNVNPHNGCVSAHALRTKTDRIDAVFQQLFH